MSESVDGQSADPFREIPPGQKTGTEGLPPPAPEPDWGVLLRQTAEMGGDIGRLFMLELRLALSSLTRIVMLCLAALPVVLLAWIGLSALPGVWLYEYSGSLTLGVACFVLVQVLVLLLVRVALARYQRTLSLPLTRQQISEFTGGADE